MKCGGHNRNKHRLEITERRDKVGKLIQFRRDGTPITPVGQRLRLSEDEADDSGECTCSPGSPATLDWPIQRIDYAA